MIIIPQVAPYQIVLDTNVVVATLRSRRGASFNLVSLLESRLFEINLSVPLVIEYEAVLLRLRNELWLSTTDIADFLDYLCRIARLHEVHFLWRPLLRDPSDEMVLELAVAAGCQLIVTYNKRDFSGVETFGIEVQTAREFLQTIKELP